jgi:NDP-sugar pyrophosphorylase family protein
MNDKAPETAIILAGGKGTRLRPITYRVPKSLVSINGKPVIEHIINELTRNGINDIVISIGYKADMIMRYLKGAHLKANISYVVEKEALGTGGGLKLALRSIRKRHGGDVFLVYGDAVFRFDIRKMYRFHKEKNALITMAIRRKKDVAGDGVVILSGTRVTEFIEKPDPASTRSHMTNPGKYILKMKVLGMLPKKRRFSFERDFLQNAVSSINLQGYPITLRQFPIDTPERLERARKNWQYR